jgi:hypothetical protein
MSMPSSRAFVAETPSSSPSALLRGVAGPVRRQVRVVAEPVGGEAVDQLRRLAALREGEGAQPAVDEERLQLRRLREGGRAETELGVEQLRVPEDDRSLGAWRGVVADHRHLLAEERRAELAGVRDRRRREEELRLGAVDPREPQQPAQDVRAV